MYYIAVIVVNILFGLGGRAIYKHKNRSPAAGFWLGFLLSWLGLIICALSKSYTAPTTNYSSNSHNYSGSSSSSTNNSFHVRSVEQQTALINEVLENKSTSEGEKIQILQNLYRTNAINVEQYTDAVTKVRELANNVESNFDEAEPAKSIDEPDYSYSLAKNNHLTGEEKARKIINSTYSEITKIRKLRDLKESEEITEYQYLQYINEVHNDQ